MSKDLSPIDLSPIDEDVSPIDKDPVIVDLEKQLETKDSALVGMRIQRVVTKAQVNALRRQLLEVRDELALAVDAQDWTAVEAVIARLSE